MSNIGLQPYRDIIRDVANAPESVWHSISKDWYNSLLAEAEKLSAPKACDTCKWWGASARETNYGGGFRVKSVYRSCDNPKLNGMTEGISQMPNGKSRSYGTCVMPDDCVGESAEQHLSEGWIEKESTHTIPLDEAQPSAADEHGIAFLTGPKFGCIHHEPK